ncbi:MAG: family 78 glycoside hydrolase catalytic domain [Candidatus Hydrogenedentes bacterium]|nr:family 78 glycoside hydrolase catalytic domain [Candidatus Hydrogenedentota bacterium]
MRLFCSFLLILVAASPSFAEALVEAQWVRDPRMEGQPIRDYYGRQPKQKTESDGPWNLHTLFRKEIQLRARPKEARLLVTGDDYYKFSINGKPVVQGPEPGYPFAYPYYRLDVPAFLEAGTNVLGSHLFYQGLVNRVWNSGDNRSGFLLSLRVTYEDGTREEFLSDGSWRCFPLLAFPGMRTTGYSTQFLEDIDLRLMPVGWQVAGFDDSAWFAPLVERQDHVFVEQLTPPLQVYRMMPAVKKTLGKGRYFFDFGREIVGCTRIQIKGAAGDVLTVRHGEELEDGGNVRYALRANCVYEEKPVLSGGDDLIEFYDYKGFRYVEVLEAPAAPEVWVDVRHHPFPEWKARFQSSDKNLTATWNICRNGVQMGSQGSFLDCPTREKGQYLGDALITSRSHLWLTGDGSLTRKALNDFQYSRRIHPGLMAVAPGNTMQEIAEYSLQFPLMLREYYRQTGDRAFTELMATAVFPGLFSHFRRYENEHGLLENYTEKQILVDWPESLRGEFDYENSINACNTVLNAFYYGALKAAADLLKELGRESTLYEAWAQQVAEGFATQLADPKTGLYHDSSASKHSSLHANAIPLAFGLSAGADKERMLELIARERLNCGVYIASFVIEACFRSGAPDLGYSLITGEEKNSWREMLRNGATACTETWAPEQKKNMSWCHPWSSSPLYLLAEYVMGLSPATPGWTRIRFAPPRIEGLPEMTLTVPHPKGRMTVHYTPQEGYRLSVPTGVPVDTPAAPEVKLIVEELPAQDQALLSEGQMRQLESQGWPEHVGAGLGVWVDVKHQMLYVLENLRPVWQARVATAAAGVGSEAGTMKTPPGWHVVAEKIGAGAPWGQVFRSRAPSGQIWKPGDDTQEDLVLTRILWLDGLEEGKNKGRNAQGHSVDSKSRCIYIHGTNGEALIGTPSSHGCIRLLNDDVITAFDLIPENAPVLITP